MARIYQIFNDQHLKGTVYIFWNGRFYQGGIILFKLLEENGCTRLAKEADYQDAYSQSWQWEEIVQNLMHKTICKEDGQLPNHYTVKDKKGNSWPVIS